MDEPSYQPPRWLSNPHLQLAWGTARPSRPSLPFLRETLETPDGDALVLDHVEANDPDEATPAGPARTAFRPRLIALHGLEGSSFSPSVQGILRLARERGWNATAVNFRSCARDPRHLRRQLENRTARLYHSGETTDLDFAVGVLSRREPRAPMLAVGASIGGNVLLKWLGERGADAPVRAAAAYSTPYDLLACARNLESPVGRFYASASLRTLRPKALSVTRRFPEADAVIDRARVAASRTFFEFDDAATAPLHGFAGAGDYYARSSSLAFLGSIRRPTLCVSARNDPFLPAPALEKARRAGSPAVEFRIPDSGSHLAFPEGAAWRLRSWAEREIVGWLGDHLE